MAQIQQITNLRSKCLGKIQIITTQHQIESTDKEQSYATTVAELGTTETNVASDEEILDFIKQITNISLGTTTTIQLTTKVMLVIRFASLQQREQINLKEMKYVDFADYKVIVRRHVEETNRRQVAPQKYASYMIALDIAQKIARY